MLRRSLAAVLAVATAFGCSSSEPAAEAPPADAGTNDSVIDAAVAADAASVDAAAPLTAASVLAKLTGCAEVTKSRYKTDADPGVPADVPICGLKNALFWKADMDIDCDGKASVVCNKSTDPAYQSQTSATDSAGDPLDSSTLPFVVVPLPSTRFDYKAAGLALGSVIMVIYQDRFEFGIFGDEGPSSIIGEASYAMAKKLGIPSSPSTGGVDSGVTYVAFTGKSAVVTKNEDHDEAVRVGTARAEQLLREN
ncbi:MAG: glycoside hydrolase family 75 protein [Polyangiaceae bacterium]